MIQYIELCERGEFYEYLMTEGGVPDYKRDEFKREFFAHAFFCRNHERYEDGLLFERLFPNVMKVMRELKRNDYTQAATMLQRVESSLMLNRVVRRLMDEHPDVPVFTIHDSIMTLPSHCDTVRSILLQEFARVGLRPSIKTEKYTTTTTEIAA